MMPASPPNQCRHRQPRSHAWAITAALAVILSAMLAAMLGCPSTPRHTYVDAQDTYITAVQELNSMYDRGEFTDQEWDTEVLPLINAGDKALDMFDAATQAGLSGEEARATLRDVILALQPLLTRKDE